jgi:hypothetical protein
MMPNSVYGKTMEDTLGHVQTTYSARPSILQARINNPNFLGFHVITDNYAVAFMNKPQYKLEQPMATGVAVLELSKLMMYSFYYKALKVVFPKVRLGMTDTDSVLVSIPYESESELHAGIKKIAPDWLDLSAYPKDHPLYSKQNAKIPGFMKDEACGANISHYIALRSKCYHLSMSETPEVLNAMGSGLTSTFNKCKGIPKAAAKKFVKSDYKNALDGGEVSASFYALGTRGVTHRMYLEKRQRVALKQFDDKGFLLEDGIDCLAHGHHRIKGILEETEKAEKAEKAAEKAND